jgi:hypothetical protein
MADAMREEAIRLAEEQAFDEGQICEHCLGDGRVPGGTRLIHSVSPAGFGADWSVESVINALRTSPKVWWMKDRGWSDHQLVIDIDGRAYVFGVKRP